MSAKNIFSKILLSLGFLSLSFGGIFAAVDISLSDNTEDQEISITIDSNDEYLDGIDMDIVMSDNVVINDENLPENIDSCSLGGRIYQNGNKLYIECFNDSGTVMNDVIATIPYSTEAVDYYFYIDTDSLDLGLEDLGLVTNINYTGKEITELVEENTDTNAEESEKSSSFLTFLSKNILYIAIVVIAIIVITIFLTGRTPKEERSSIKDEMNTSENADSSSPTTIAEETESPESAETTNI